MSKPFNRDDEPGDRAHFADLFHAAMESSLDAFMILRPIVEHNEIVDWVIEYVNDRARRMFPTQHGTATGKRVGDLWGDSLAVDDFLKVYRSVLSEGTAHEDVLPITFSETNRLWIRRQVVSLGDGVAITARDVTADHERALELRTSQQMYRTFIENAAEGVWALDTERRTTFVNAKMAAMLGYTPDEMVGQHVDHFTAERDKEFAANRFELMRGGLIDTYDRPCLHRDGSIVWVELSTTQILNDNGDFVGSFGFATDQSRRHAAEDALRESEERYRTIVETTSEGIIACDRDGVILFANSTACTMLGRSSDALIGQQVAHFLEANAGENVTDRYREAVRSRSSFFARSELHIVRPDGSSVWADIRAATLGGSSTRDPGVLIALSDGTDRRAADEARGQLSLQLASAENRQRTNLANDLHDGAIQTLAAVALRLGILRRDTQTSDAATSSAAKELEIGVLNTVRELRTLLFELAPPDPEGGGLARALRNLAEAIVGGTTITVQVEDTDEVHVPQNTALVLLRVASEALSNVLRHSNATDISITLAQDAQCFIMRIADNGVGFDIPTIRNTPGHYGLTAMADRARASGGDISFESTVDHGTTIVALIPYI